MKTTALAFLLVAALGIPAHAGSSPAAGFPDEAFEELTEEELLRFLAVFPGVQEAMEQAEYEPELDRAMSAADALAGIVRGAEGIGDVPGVDSILASASLEWADFRVTMLKLVAVVAAVSEEFGLLTGAWQQDKPGKNGTVPFSRLVPASNIELVREHAEELDVDLE